MKAKFVYENLDFEKGADPHDTMKIGDVLGRKIERIKREGYSGESSTLEAIEMLKRMLGDEWVVDTIGPTESTFEIHLRKAGDWYRGPSWSIRDLGRKGQFISYQYNQPGQSTSKPFFRNIKSLIKLLASSLLEYSFNLEIIRGVIPITRASFTSMPRSNIISTKMFHD